MAPGQLTPMGNSRELPVWTFPFRNRALFSMRQAAFACAEATPSRCTEQPTPEGEPLADALHFYGHSTIAVSEQALHRLDDVLGSDA
jgi:hypothetical protein